MAATTDAGGRYSIPRCADFPRSFVLREDDEVEPTRTLPTEVVLDRPGAPEQSVAQLSASGYLNVVVGEEAVVDAPEVVIARLASVAGRVVNSEGKGIAGALVTRSMKGGFAANGSALGTSLPSLPWSDPEFVLGQGRCLTRADGTYQLQVEPPEYGRTEQWLAAYSPGRGVGATKVDGVVGGASLGGVDFELNDAETARIRLVLPAGDAALRELPSSAKLIWDCSGERGVLEPSRGSSLIMTFATTPVIATSPDGSWVVVPEAHQPDRGARAGELAGTLFVEGFQPARFELEPGAMQGEVELAPLQRVALRLELKGSGTKWFKRATVVVTPEMPDPELTAEKNVSRHGVESPIRTKEFGWQDGEERTIGAFGDRPVFAYVELVGTSPRGTISLPAFGPIPLAGAEGDGPFVLEAELGDWPAGVVPVTVAAKPDASPLLNERRTTTITARVVSAADGSFIMGAGADVVEGGIHPGGSQREWKGEQRPITLELSAEVATLRFKHAQYVPQVMGPLTLTAGDAMDLGEIRLEPLRKIPCQLVDSSGEPARKGIVISRNDPEVGWAQMKTDAEGRFDLFVGSTGPTPLRIRNRGGSRDPSSTASVDLLPDGTDLIFICNLPPGNWTFHPARPSFATFPPEPLLVESTVPDSAGQEATLEVTIRATLKQL